MSARMTWSAGLDAMLRDVFPHVATAAIAQLLDCPRMAVHHRATKLGLKKTREAVAQASADATRARSYWSDELLEYLELMYPVQRTDDLAKFIGVPLTRVHAMANKHGWRKERDLVAQMARDRMTADHPGRKHQFQKGIVPWNTGRKGVSHPGSVPTQFKKGNRPHTWKPVGSQRVNADGYLDEKISDTGYAPRDWIAVHRLVWIRANGPIPPNHVVSFKPGRHSTKAEDITLDAIECVHRGVLATRNHPRARHPELGRITQLRAVMTRMINKRTREAAAQGEAA